MSCIAVLATVLVGITASYLLTKGVLRKFKNPLDLVLSSPFSIPGTVVAIYLILAFDSPTLFTGGTVLVGTFWLMPLAYFIRTYPFVLRSVSSSLERLDDSMLEAAESLGAGISFRFRRVVVPIILPAVISGSLLVMISSLGEFVASILLYTPTNRPISIEILSQLRGYNFGSAAAYSIFLLLIVMVLTVISGRVVRQSVGTQPSGLNF
jgi:iron(III) transport system permease protein